MRIVTYLTTIVCLILLLIAGFYPWNISGVMPIFKITITVVDENHQPQVNLRFLPHYLIDTKAYWENGFLVTTGDNLTTNQRGKVSFALLASGKGLEAFIWQYFDYASCKIIIDIMGEDNERRFIHLPAQVGKAFYLLKHPIYQQKEFTLQVKTQLLEDSDFFNNSVPFCLSK